MGAQLAEEAERVKLAHGVREQVDADAEGPQLGRRVEEVDLHAGLVQAQGGGQASDPGADDHATPDGSHRRHRTSCTWMRTVLCCRSPVETATRSFNQLSRGAAVDRRTRVRK